MLSRSFVAAGCLPLLCALASAASPDIPQLAWQERSDWINVRTDVTPAAVGDGRADDTAAIQAALDQGGEGKTVYLPPGTYRITDTLALNGPAVGSLVIGHGRDTRLVWDGPEGGRMFWSNGIAYSRYVGLSWDGRGKAAVGFDHAAQQRFETEVRHEHEAFRNFTGFGIRIGHQQKVASAEILYRNCLFENCGTALAFLTFNDYDNTVDGCEFRNCGIGRVRQQGQLLRPQLPLRGQPRSGFRGRQRARQLDPPLHLGRLEAVHRRTRHDRPADDPGLPRRRLDRSRRGRAPERQPGADVRLLLHPAAVRPAAREAGQRRRRSCWSQQQPAGAGRAAGAAPAGRPSCTSSRRGDRAA